MPRASTLPRWSWHSSCNPPPSRPVCAATSSNQRGPRSNEHWKTHRTYLDARVRACRGGARAGRASSAAKTATASAGVAFGDGRQADHSCHGNAGGTGRLNLASRSEDSNPAPDNSNPAPDNSNRAAGVTTNNSADHTFGTTDDSASGAAADISADHTDYADHPDHTDHTDYASHVNHANNVNPANHANHANHAAEYRLGAAGHGLVRDPEIRTDHDRGSGCGRYVDSEPHRCRVQRRANDCHAGGHPGCAVGRSRKLHGHVARIAECKFPGHSGGSRARMRDVEPDAGTRAARSPGHHGSTRSGERRFRRPRQWPAGDPAVRRHRRGRHYHRPGAANEYPEHAARHSRMKPSHMHEQFAI